MSKNNNYNNTILQTYNKDVIKSKTSNTSHYLDTLETTSDYFINKSHENQYHKGIAKYCQNKKVDRLIDATNDKNRKQKYSKTYHCNRVLLQNGNSVVGSLCRKRWCSHCSRIKTAELINGYLMPLISLSKEDNLYLVTLTAPTCESRQLRSEIRKRLKAFQRVKDNMRQRYNMKLNGYRKIEVTFSKGKYHPHLHLIVQGYAEAETLRKLWLNQFKTASIKANDIRQIEVSESNVNALKEVFKYATKQSVKDETPAKAEDHIYECLEGLRIFQPYGKLRKVKEPKEAKEEKDVCTWLPYQMDVWVFEQSLKDWTNSKNQRMVNTLQIENLILKNNTKIEQNRTLKKEVKQNNYFRK